MINIDEDLSKLLQLVRCKSAQFETYISVDIEVNTHDLDITVYLSEAISNFFSGFRKFNSVEDAMKFLLLLNGVKENDNEGL